MSVNVGRRALIASAMGLGVAAYLGTIGFGALQPCGANLPRLAALPGARRIAAALLAQGYAPRDVGKGDLSAMAAGLTEAAQADFAAGQTVFCDGWLLSHAEADFAIACTRDA